jgi:hypothetical protein
MYEAKVDPDNLPFELRILFSMVLAQTILLHAVSLLTD